MCGSTARHDLDDDHAIARSDLPAATPAAEL
jgi:hypothetical protein